MGDLQEASDEPRQSEDIAIDATAGAVVGGISGLLVGLGVLLIPGVGAQGGSLADVAKYGFNGKCGLIVNSSRAIIYADKTEKFADVAREKALEVQQEMSELLTKYKVVK